MTHRQTGYQLVHGAGSEEADAAASAAAIAIEVVHPTQVGIGMVVATHHLPQLTHHRPAALQVQGNPSAIEPELFQVLPGMTKQLGEQIREAGIPMELPDPVEIPCPGAAGIWVGVGACLQLPDRLQLQGQIEGIGLQLHLPQGQGE